MILLPSLNRLYLIVVLLVTILSAVQVDMLNKFIVKSFRIQLVELLGQLFDVVSWWNNLEKRLLNGFKNLA